MCQHYKSTHAISTPKFVPVISASGLLIAALNLAFIYYDNLC
jgi:hypothetical protein